MRTSAKWILAIAVAGAAVVGVALVALAASSFISFRNSGDELPALTGMNQVAIGRPVQGTNLVMNEAVTISAVASGPEPMEGIELWVDDELAGWYQGEKGASLTADFFWTPTELGRHSLIARAVVAEDQSYTSAVVHVEVVAEEGVAEIQEGGGRGAVYPAASGGGGQPGGPSSGSAVGPASVHSGSVGDWISSFLPASPPAAPELTAIPAGCAADLSLHDLSTNEEGFRLYRQAANSSQWQQVASLDGQSQFEWLEWTDPAGPGTFSYYALAFNQAGTAASNPVSVALPGGNCPQIQMQGLQLLSTQVTEFFPGLESNGAYCYYSANGINWQRWPVQGFIFPGESFMPLSGPMMRTITAGPLQQNGFQPMAGFMECWNWQDSGLQDLGSYEIMPTEGGTGLEYHLADETGELVMKMKAEQTTDPVWPLSGGESEVSAAPNTPDLEYLFRPDMPRPYLQTTEDQLKCAQYMPSSFQPEDICFQTEEGENHYLIWSLDGPGHDCLGTPAIECLTYEDFLSLAHATDGQVWFVIHDLNSSGEFNWVVDSHGVRALTVPYVQCTGERGFWVEMFYQPGKVLTAGEDTSADPLLHEIQAVALGETGPLTKIPQPLSFQSPPSNMVTVPCPPPPTTFLNITVQFGELVGSLLDDDDVGITDLEIYGYVRVEAPALGHYEEVDPFFGWGDPQTVLLGARRYLNLARWNEQLPDCPDESGVQGFYSPEWGCPQEFEEAAHSFADLYSCPSDSKHDCAGFDGGGSTFSQGNNTIPVIVEEGDGLVIEVKFIDFDDGSDNDIYCEDSLVIEGRSLDEWADVSDLSFTLTDTTDSGSCVLEGSISGSPLD